MGDGVGGGIVWISGIRWGLGNNRGGGGSNAGLGMGMEVEVMADTGVGSGDGIISEKGKGVQQVYALFLLASLRITRATPGTTASICY